MSTYTLITPITAVSGKTLRELTLRDHYTVGDVLAARKASDASDAGFALIGRVAGLDDKELLQLDMRDVDQLDRHIEEIRKDPKVAAAEQAATSSKTSENA